MSSDGQTSSIVIKIQEEAHQELNKVGEPNQIYYMMDLITRCYLARTILSPNRGIQDVLLEYKQSIFRGVRFSLHDFLTIGIPAVNHMQKYEIDKADQMR